MTESEAKTASFTTDAETARNLSDVVVVETDVSTSDAADGVSRHDTDTASNSVNVERERQTDRNTDDSDRNTETGRKSNKARTVKERQSQRRKSDDDEKTRKCKGCLLYTSPSPRDS